MFEIRCVNFHDRDRLKSTVGPADVAADALRVCPMASGLGFADHVIIVIIIMHGPDAYLKSRGRVTSNRQIM